MAAIITDSIKKQIIQEILDDTVTSNYFVGIGRSQTWDDSDVTPTLSNTQYEQRKFRENLQSVKLTESISFVIPRHNWSSGTPYSAYNDAQSGYPTNPYYVLTNANSVYVCLEVGKNTTGNTVVSVVEPTGSSTTPFKTSDGYVWKFLYTVGASDSLKFLSSNFMPVKLQDATDSDSTAIEIEQEGIQNAAVSGQIGSIVTDGGSNYDSPTVTISGNGINCEAFATVVSGTITKIQIDSDGLGNIKNGSGYDHATVTISDTTGSGAEAKVVLSPENGFGADPRNDLKSSGIMFNIKPEGDENGDFLIGQDFRQVGLIKNPTYGDSDSLYISSTGICLSSLTINPLTSAFTNDKIILGGTSGAQAYVDHFDSDTLYFHQDEETGFTDFLAGEVITETAGSGSGKIDVINTPDVNPMSGDVLYIENRAAIDRSTDQTEDIKLVIQL